MIKAASFTYYPMSEVKSTVDNVQNVFVHLDKIKEYTDIVVLPETFNSLRLKDSKNISSYAEDIDGNTITNLRKKASLMNCYFVAPILLREKGEIYNSAVLIDKKGEIAGIHKKIHLPKDEVDKGILPGDQPTVIETEIGKIGLVICYELNFDSLRTAYKKLNPDIIAFTSMFPGGRMLQSWALLNSVQIISCCPHEDWGLFIDPLGKITARSSYYERIIIRNINLDYKVLHLQSNYQSLSLVKNKYGSDIDIKISCPEGLAVIYGNNKTINLNDICNEFKLITWQKLLSE